MRTRELFDGGWRFQRGDLAIGDTVKAGMLGGLADAMARKKGKHLVVAFVDRGSKVKTDPEKWREVTVPHDWVVEGPFEKMEDGTHGYRPRGTGFYRKVFSLPAGDRGKRLILEFDGIFRRSTIWVNGHHLLDHRSGYTSFQVDITDVARCGKEGPNCVLVRVDARDTEGWWYEGAGIYRHVWLVKTGMVRVGQWGTFVSTPRVSEKRAQIRVETTVLNGFKAAVSVRVRSTVVDGSGKRVASQETPVSIAGDGRSVLVQTVAVRNPRLWSPDSPAMYQLLTEVKAGGSAPRGRDLARFSTGGKPVDRYTTPFGIRTIRFDADRGLFVNGVHTPVKGTCNHQDFAGVGVALPDSLHEYKIKVLKGMGSNAYRCAHHPPAPELLDACDRLGMLVMDENRKLTSAKEGLEDLESMILRDRNHPSVFIWGMENEEPLEGTPMGARILDTLVRRSHQLDPTRLTTAAQNHGHVEGGYSAKVDVKGFNYGHNGDKDMKSRPHHPGKPVMATESNATYSTRGIYADLPGKGYATAYGTNVWKPPYEWNTGFFIPWQAYLRNPLLTGVFVWAGFDYRGEPGPYNWPCVVTNFGVIDLCGFPKDGYWHHRAMWSSEPVLHLMPHWNHQGKEGREIKVWALTNLERVDLFLNGRPLGSREILRGGYGEWVVPYEAGTLSATGWKGGRNVVETAIATTGQVKFLALVPDRNKIRADGRDAVPVRINMVDEDGRVVPTACVPIRFRVSGPARIIGVGNGDPASHEPEKGDRVRSFNGHGLAILQSTGNKGRIILSAAMAGGGKTRVEIRAG